MAKLQCPNCGASVPNPEGWAKAVLSTLMVSPAIPHMATQVRCQQCQHVFDQFDDSQRIGWRALWPAVFLIAVLLAIAVLLPG
jgi:ribosomal protein S27E